MQKIKYVLGSINLINIALTAVLSMMVLYVALPLFRVSLNVPVVRKPAANTAAEGNKTAGSAEPHGKGEKTPVISFADYQILADQNVFHPERIIPVEKKEAAPLPMPDFVLYGTLLTNSVQIAYLEDKKALKTSPGRGRRQIALSKGQSLSGFTLKEVYHERIVMVRGEESVEVRVIDPSKRKPDGKGKLSASGSASSSPLPNLKK